MQTSKKSKKSSSNDHDSSNFLASNRESLDDESTVSDLKEEKKKVDTLKTDSKKTKKTNLDEFVRIELNSVVEHNGNFYRGVQMVDQNLAKVLTNLDNPISSEGKR
jgi:hypothetical protein